jgi:hypothetical protein
MARYERYYAGERRTVKRTLQLTPSEDRELSQAAEAQGATWSDYSRELLLHRSAAVVAATRRNPEAKALLRELELVGRELNAIGNNLNQLARHVNTTGDLRDWSELRDALDSCERNMDMHKLAVSRVLGL